MRNVVNLWHAASIAVFPTPHQLNLAIHIVTIAVADYRQNNLIFAQTLTNAEVECKPADIDVSNSAAF